MLGDVDNPMINFHLKISYNLHTPDYSWSISHQTESHQIIKNIMTQKILKQDISIQDYNAFTEKKLKGKHNQQTKLRNSMSKK